MINQALWASKYASHSGETYEQGCARVAKFLQIPELERILLQRRFSPGGRVWYGAGKRQPYLINCALMRVGDSKEAWARLVSDVTLALTSGMGVGVDYSAVRPYGSHIRGSGGTASGPISLMQMTNELARYIMQGNQRRSALLAQLHWRHHDIDEFIKVKTWDEVLQRLKALDPVKYAAPLDLTNISVQLDPDFLTKLADGSNEARATWEALTYAMFSGSEPGIRFNPDTQVLTNACGEIVSSIDHDTCTLGSINLSEMTSYEQLEETIKIAMHTLVAARKLSLYPTDSMRSVALEHPRVGLGVMGLHNWLIKRNLPYAWCPELERLFKFIQDVAVFYGQMWAAEYGLPPLEGHIAHAPTGSISLLFGGISGGIEPIFAKAYKRRYVLDGMVREDYVVDANVQKFLRLGIDPASIEDAYSLATPKGVERRVAMQAHIQQYCDNSISSTINLPAWGSDGNNATTLREYQAILLRYLPQLRGITVYADGSRGGQPLTAVSVEEALEHRGENTASYSACNGGACSM